MQNFELEPGMLSMGGVFYPTGYLFVMFPQIEDAQHVAAGLPAEHPEKPNFLLPPDTVLEKIVGTIPMKRLGEPKEIAAISIPSSVRCRPKVSVCQFLSVSRICA